MVNSNLRYITCSAFAKMVFLSIALLSVNSASARNKDKAPAKSDTFSIAKKLIANKKFGKAGKVLKRYSASHPKDVNATWLLAQVNLYAGNYKRSDAYYQSAIKAQPANDYLKLNYIHSLADMGKSDRAETMLFALENNNVDYSDISMLHARLNYYGGDNKRAAAYMKKVMQYTDKKDEAYELNDLIENARAAKISLNESYLSDNQPVNILTSTIRLEKNFNRSLGLFVECNDYHFMQTTTTDAPWLKIGDRLFMPKAGLHFNIGGGILQFPYNKTIAWTVELGLNKTISPQFDVDINIDRSPYFGTRASIDTTIMTTRFAGMLNWHKNNWLGQAAFLNNSFEGSNNVYSAYAYVLVPVVAFSNGKLQAGISTSYSNSTESRYRAVNSLADIITNYNPSVPIAGVYAPYFTPDNMMINSALLSFTISPSKKTDIYLNGDAGSGSIQNPYVYLDKNSSGTVFLNRGFSTEHFTPYSASAGISYHINRSWQISGKYTYRSTYFFTSNFVTVRIEKSFLHHDKQRKDDKGSAFSKKIKEIENEIQGLYKSKNPSELKHDVAGIRSKLVAMRDEQQRQKSMTEVTPGSDKAQQLQERFNSLNEMIADLDSVALNDNEQAVSKREWMVDKQYELTAVRYNGSLDDE